MLPDFYSHIAYSFYLALVLVGDFNLLNVCWKLNTTDRSQSRRLLEYVEENFLPQLEESLARAGAPLDLLFTKAGVRWCGLRPFGVQQP